MGDLETLMAETQSRISELISKPKMSAKLLSKPPFRFLHDTITAITNATGFGEGLYSAEELDAAAITDKNAKMAYLDKIFLLVGICKGYQLEVKALRVVQGLDPEFTNQFLIALAQCAADATIDNTVAVQKALSNEAPGASPPPRKSGGGIPPHIAESKSSEPDHSSSKNSSDDRKSYQAEAPREVESKMPIEMDQPVIPERGKSRGGTRGGKPQQATADTGLSGFGNSMAPRLDAEIEKCDGSVETTQRLLGELITRPKLAEKLLGKPPFKFLFDIVMEVIRATGFARGLYSDFESDSANVSSREQKIEFLEKITKVVGVHLNTLVEAKPTKIVAGLEPQDTNTFLQLLAIAAKHMPDSTVAVNTVLEQGSGANVAVAAPAPRPTTESPPREAPPAKVEVEAAPVRRSQPSMAPPAEAKEVMGGQNRDFIQDDKQPGQDNGGDGGGDGNEDKRSTRPSTARRRPPKVKEGASELQAKDTAVPAAKKASGIIVDGADDDEVDEVIGDDTGSRLVDELRAESKGGDDGNANPQSKLVQNIMSRQVEQEAASGGRNKDSKAVASPVETVDESKQGDNAGGGIRLSRMRKPGADKKGKDNAPQVATSFAEGDLEKMRHAIQALVQQTGPLGTCLDFIQEDVSLMSGELHKWEEECRRYEAEYDEARKKTKEKLIPLRNELDELNDQIAEQIALISAAKTSNLKLEDKIQSTLKMIATS